MEVKKKKLVEKMNGDIVSNTMFLFFFSKRVISYFVCEYMTSYFRNLKFEMQIKGVKSIIISEQI